MKSLTKFYCRKMNIPEEEREQLAQCTVEYFIPLLHTIDKQMSTLLKDDRFSHQVKMSGAKSLILAIMNGFNIDPYLYALATQNLKYELRQFKKNGGN